ncbi:MAG: hypothetical protein EOP83_05940 [Verrucomicrobiaceae bacterium]|nr:MAG: hypothetical protein EOP83_05940 [Verrucomicrobiaceae bacterium]
MSFHHFIGISEGKIEITVAGLTRGKPTAFFSERNAAIFLARNILRSGSARIMTSSSCNWPADSGRPNFSMDRFNDLVDKYLLRAAA